MRTQLLRASRVLGRRSASTEAAQEKAKATANAAAETASRYASQASSAVQSVLGQAGTRLSGALGSYQAPVTYNLAVARELAKQVYIKEGLAPPSSLAQVQSVYSQLFQKATDLSYWRSIAQNGQWIKVAVYAVEAIGIFSIGEMIGRRHIVGYKLKGPKPAGDHH